DGRARLGADGIAEGEQAFHPIGADQDHGLALGLEAGRERGGLGGGGRGQRGAAGGGGGARPQGGRAPAARPPPGGGLAAAGAAGGGGGGGASGGGRVGGAMARRGGWLERPSRAAAGERTRSAGEPPRGMTSVTRGEPVVRVPVLSKATTSRWPTASTKALPLK